MRKAAHSTMTDDGKRYTAKSAGSMFGKSTRTRSCFGCSKHSESGEGIYKNVMGKPQFFCTQKCIDGMFPKKAKPADAPI